MNLTEIIIAVVGLIFAILSTKLFPLAKVNMTSAQYSALLMVTKVLVYAAEQIYGSGGGKVKLEYVIATLEEKGYTVDLDMIEAIVRELSIEQK